MREISSLRMPLKPAARCQTCLRVLDNPVEAPPRAPAPAPPKRVLGARLSLLKPAAASAWIIRSCMINLEGVRIRGRVHNPPYLLTQVPRDERRDNRRNVSSEHMLAGASEETKVKKEKSSGTLGTGHPHYVHSGLLAHMAQGTQVLHVC
ncbi:uncharacterized protein LOC127977678 isoform X4 [Carassius gibelio]|uniref:uncharacterized protein LOC127977678 isoform X4 n=1 Tax=Carassius gibelio TaxID=101364 RepID=UPI002279579F|nr:uncharacterized protein LOC127977678 isoform X4 [Carassius gibelio]